MDKQTRKDASVENMFSEVEENLAQSRKLLREASRV